MRFINSTIMKGIFKFFEIIQRPVAKYKARKAYKKKIEKLREIDPFRYTIH